MAAIAVLRRPRARRTPRSSSPSMRPQGPCGAEGRYETTLLYSRHAALLELEDISDALALLGIVLGLEKWLEGPESSTDEARSRRVRYLRGDVLDELWFTCEQPEVGRRELREEQTTLAR